MNYTDLKSMTKSERAAWEMENAERALRLFAPTMKQFEEYKKLEAAWHRTPGGINALYAAGHKEAATASAIANLRYDGNAAAMRARAEAGRTSRALEEARTVTTELSAAVEERTAAKQTRTRERAQGKVDAAVERVGALVSEGKEHAASSAREAEVAVEKSQRVAFQAPSAKKALLAAERAALRASLLDELLADAEALDAGEEVEELSYLPESGDELLSEEDYLDPSDYDDYSPEGNDEGVES